MLLLWFYSHIKVGFLWGVLCLTKKDFAFVSRQDVRSYQDWYRLVTVNTHSEFIVLYHWETWSWHNANEFFAYIIIDKRSSFPKRIKRHSRKWACNSNTRFKILYFGKELFTCVYICIYVYIYEELFFSPKTWSPNLALALIATSIFELTLNAFSKRTNLSTWLWSDNYQL